MAKRNVFSMLFLQYIVKYFNKTLINDINTSQCLNNLGNICEVEDAKVKTDRLLKNIEIYIFLFHSLLGMWKST